MYMKSYMRDTYGSCDSTKDFHRLLYKIMVCGMGFFTMLLGSYIFTVNVFAGTIILLLGMPVLLFGLVYFRKTEYKR